MNTIMKIMKNDTEEKNDSSFSYPANEDIYNKSINEADKIPEINSFQKSNNKDITDLKQNEDGIFENDLDVPGSELEYYKYLLTFKAINSADISLQLL